MSSAIVPHIVCVVCLWVAKPSSWQTSYLIKKLLKPIIKFKKMFSFRKRNEGLSTQVFKFLFLQLQGKRWWWHSSITNTGTLKAVMVKEKLLHARPTSTEVPTGISCHLTECPLPRYSFPQAGPQSQPRATDAIPTPWFKKKKQKPGMMRDLFKVMQPVAGVDLTFSLPTPRRVLCFIAHGYFLHAP